MVVDEDVPQLERSCVADLWGRLFTCWPISNRPCPGYSASPSLRSRPRWDACTRPRKRFRCCNNPGLHRIPFNVSHNILKLSIIPNESVITLILPKRPPHNTQHLIPLPRRESLERLHKRRHLDQRRNQKMNVVGHDDKCMQIIVPPILIPNRVGHHFSHLRPLQVQRPRDGVIEQPVHGDKGLSRRDRRWERSIRRETSVQPPRQKDRFSYGVEVRQAATVKGRHKQGVGSGGDCSLLEGMGRLLIGPQVTNLPHKAAEILAAQGEIRQ